MLLRRTEEEGSGRRHDRGRQTGQIFRKVPAGGLRVEQITKNHERFLHDGGKVHNSGHRDRLLSTTRTYSVIDGLSILRGATDFAKLQLGSSRTRQTMEIGYKYLRLE